MRGWSKLQNYNSGDWNTRKYKQFTITTPDGGYTAGTLYDSSACSTPRDWFWGIVVTTPTAVWDVVTNTQSVFASQLEYVPCPEYSCSGLVNPYDRTNVLALQAAVAPYSSTAKEDTTYTQTINAASCAAIAQWSCRYPDTCSTFLVSSWRSLPSSRRHVKTLENPDTVSDALGRGTPEVGSICKTTATSIGSTTEASTTQISVSSATAVVATLAASGLTASTDYEIEITLKRYTAGGGAYVDSITDTITFTASGATEDIEYNVPVNTDYDYELSAASIAAA